jgi:hypothetical protein
MANKKQTLFFALYSPIGRRGRPRHRFDFGRIKRTRSRPQSQTDCLVRVDRDSQRSCGGVMTLVANPGRCRRSVGEMNIVGHHPCERAPRQRNSNCPCRERCASLFIRRLGLRPHLLPAPKEGVLTDVRVGHRLNAGIYNLNPPLRDLGRCVRNQTANEQEESDSPNHFQSRN